MDLSIQLKDKRRHCEWSETERGNLLVFSCLRLLLRCAPRNDAFFVELFNAQKERGMQ